jgi:hypothetical protein
MIVLFTDFGASGPYVGQLKVQLRREAPEVPVIDLFADAPSRNPKAAAYLLAAYAAGFPEGTVFLAVVDPGVGGERQPLAVHVDDRWFVGPDNGLFEMVIRRARRRPRPWRIDWRPQRLSASFHGRDLFAPVAGRLARQGGGMRELGSPTEVVRPQWPDDLAEIIYIDEYGNGITGIRASTLTEDSKIVIGETVLCHARTFSMVPAGQAFWYANANGLVEIAVNMGRAASTFGLRVGVGFRVR